jgi:hypothetical protein
VQQPRVGRFASLDVQWWPSLRSFALGGSLNGAFRSAGFGSGAFRAGPGSTSTLRILLLRLPLGFRGGRPFFESFSLHCKLVQGELVYADSLISLFAFAVGSWVSSTTEVVSAGCGSNLISCIAGSIGNTTNAIRTTARTKPYIRKPFNAGRV